MDANEKSLRLTVINSVLKPHLRHKPGCASLRKRRPKKCNCGLQKAIDDALE